MATVQSILSILPFILVGLLWKHWGLIVSKNFLNHGSLHSRQMSPYPPGPIKGKEKYQVTMSLKKLDKENWLTIDHHYMEQYQLRKTLLHNHRAKVSKCLPEASFACEEALQEVSTFLCSKYPWMFRIERSNGDREVMKNEETGESFALDRNGEMQPLEIAARLTMEDLSILLKNDNDVHYLAATASLFPIGWSADEKVGFTIAQMHAPVPLWHKQIAYSVDKFLSRLTPEAPMERSSYFMQVTEPDEPLSSILFQPDGLVHENMKPSIENMVLRRERQTFRRLPNSGAILFGVKTSLTNVTDLPLDQLTNLATEIKSWPEDVARYKGRDRWGSIVLEFIEGKMANQ